jgi:hypothetical protein
MWCARLRCSENFHPARLKPQVCHFFYESRPQPRQVGVNSGHKGGRSLHIYTAYVVLGGATRKWERFAFRKRFLVYFATISSSHLASPRVYITKPAHHPGRERNIHHAAEREKKTHTHRAVTKSACEKRMLWREEVECVFIAHNAENASEIEICDSMNFRGHIKMFFVTS